MVLTGEHPATAQPTTIQGLSDQVTSTSTHNKTSQAILAALPADPRPLVAEVPFSSAGKWSAVAIDDQAADTETDAPLHGDYALGAPEFLQP